MKKAFTLIELLVVIAIIAILAAILFPVFAQAKLAAKKTAGLNQTKQIGLGFNLYANDTEDVLPAYRFKSAGEAINPTYLKLLAAGDPRANLIEAQSRVNVFFNQVLDPYIKNDDIWKAPTANNAWVNVQDKGTADPGFRSYGGQNSYGVNSYVFKGSTAAFPVSGLSLTAIEQVSNTLLLTDATYYNVLPKQPIAGPCKFNGFNPTGTYQGYWKQLGNGVYNFSAPGDYQVDEAATKLVEARYGGILNIVRADSSAKALNARSVIENLKDKGRDSYWNPFKSDCEL